MNNDINIAYRSSLWREFQDSHNNLISELQNIHDFYKSHTAFTKDVFKLIAQKQYLYGIFSCLDAFLSDATIDLMVSYPGKIGSLKNNTELLTEVMTLTSAIKYHAEKRVIELSYKKPSEFIAGVYSIFGEKNYSDEVVLGRIIEGKATRDLYMHNNGKVNYIYFEKAGKHARKLKDNYSLDDDYIFSIREATLSLAQDLFDRCFTKHKEDIPTKIFQKMWEMSSLNNVVSFNKQWKYSPSLFSSCDETICITEYEHPWSSSEQVLFNFFRQIHSSNGPQTNKLSISDIPSALSRWKGRVDERIIQSWLEAPFYL